ncbi:MAG TPA: ribulokinase [Segetibacter sp.]|jgi:L-ribulokinase
MQNESYCIGVDYGTDSVRSIIVNAHSGEEVASSVYYYPRWRDGLFCDPSKNQFRQHPLDYIEGIEQTVRTCLSQAGSSVRSNIKAISADTTGSTPVAVDESGTPLALLSAFANNPNAMFVLWKDHTAIQEALEINEHAKKFDVNYLKYVGGIYSSEWFWAKLLYVLRHDDQVRGACYSWVEHCDWMSFLLTGGSSTSEMKRSVCTAGHKGLWAEEFGGLPPDVFFSNLDPLLKGFTSRLYTSVYSSDKPAGRLSAEWAERLGLDTNVLVGVGAMDAHMGAVGGQIEPYYLSKVIGTSTCDMLVAPKHEINGTLVKGICGQVEGSIIPGMIGMEAGQSAFGDTYAWFKKVLSWPLQNILLKSELIDEDTANKLIAEISDNILIKLGQHAEMLTVDETTEIAIDWLNGRRTPDANQFLKGAISGLSLGTDASKIYRALVEATCFGARKITDRFKAEGIQIKGLIGVGGIAKKSPFVMQMLADVINMPIRIHSSEQTCALGAAMFAATVAGIYPKVTDAMEAMGQGFHKEYSPNSKNVDLYDKRYNQYETLSRFLERESLPSSNG